MKKIGQLMGICGVLSILSFSTQASTEESQIVDVEEASVQLSTADVTEAAPVVAPVAGPEAANPTDPRMPPHINFGTPGAGWPGGFPFQGGPFPRPGQSNGGVKSTVTAPTQNTAASAQKPAASSQRTASAALRKGSRLKADDKSTDGSEVAGVSGVTKFFAALGGGMVIGGVSGLVWYFASDSLPQKASFQQIAFPAWVVGSAGIGGLAGWGTVCLVSNFSSSK
ncbi:MAG: hypothetical protein LBJ77_01220 [Holosporales bacterium]|nr:hypothetical protein [Holosporales bacterium]